jgi:hypothetical protein
VNELTEDAAADSWAPQLRIGGFSVLLPIVLGMVLLVPWILIGGFGILLGLVVDVVAVVKWRQRYGAVFPQDIASRDLLFLFLAAVVLSGLAFLVGRA